MSASPGRTTDATLNSVASSATSVQIFAANSAIMRRTLFNESSAILYLKFASTAASLTSYTTQVAAGAMYEFPGNPCYRGAVTGIWASANGAARTTEF